jgi:hypothetical protein
MVNRCILQKFVGLGSVAKTIVNYRVNALRHCRTAIIDNRTVIFEVLPHQCGIGNEPERISEQVDIGLLYLASLVVSCKFLINTVGKLGKSYLRRDFGAIADSPVRQAHVRL